jgi:hydroxymethylglutaryl-CoA synthase
MKRNSVGISDIRIHLPKSRIDLDTLVEQRVEENPRLERHLARARRTTGQRAIRFPSVWEDTATLAASAAHKLITENPQKNVSGLRYLTVGTESGLDHSKPVSSFVEGMLQQSGVDVPESLSSFQVQHACAAGTLSLLSVSALLQASGRPGESGVVMCSDVARYDVRTTAEITQGAGAVAMLVENDPDLVEIDLGTQGYCSTDVDDFFRPLGSKTAKVKGTYSMQCYRDTLQSALRDHADRVGKTPREVLEETDLFVLHAPFRNLPETAMVGLLQNELELSDEEAREFLDDRGLYDAIDAVADVGNIYTGSMYLALSFQLYNQYLRFGAEIVGKRILFASYGSGNTMTVFSGIVAERAPEVIARWDLDALLDDYHDASFDEYQTWINGPYVAAGDQGSSRADSDLLPRFMLETIRDDGYRVYAYREETARVGTAVPPEATSSAVAVPALAAPALEARSA